MKHMTDVEMAKELEQALAFDLRDNPAVRNAVDRIVREKGVQGATDFVKLLKEDLERDLSGSRGPVLFPWTRAACKSRIEGERFYKEMGLGQILGLIGALGGALIQGVTSVYTTRLTVGAQTDIAKFQTQQVVAQADAQRAQAEAQQAVVQAQILGVTNPGTVSGGTPSGVSAASLLPGGMGIGTIALIGGGVLAAVFILPKILGR